MRPLPLLATVVIAVGLSGCAGEPVGKTAPAGSMQLKYKWVFTMCNIGEDKDLQRAIDLMKQARKAGFNGIFAQDARYSNLTVLDDHYAANARKLRTACTAERMTLVAAVAPMGYASQLLASDPNLAEGMPVRASPFVVKGGQLVPDEVVEVENGAFAAWDGNSPIGWMVDKPGTISFRDDQVRWQGNPTLRQEHVAGLGVIRLYQKMDVEPWHYYHISVMARTEGCTSKDFRIFALAGDPMNGTVLTWQPPPINETMDWTRLDAAFASLDNKEVSIYIGSYAPKAGRVWWSDVRIEPGGFVNVIRRDSLPLTITGAIGTKGGAKAFRFVEGTDFSKVADPKLGNDPVPGEFSYWHTPPTVTIPPGSRLHEGQKLLASYHIAMVVGKSHQTNCCFSEPKVYELLAKEVRWVRDNGQPDVYQMSHDEIRHAGWDDTCAKRHMTCGQLLAENVRKCVDILRGAAPGKMVTVWSDMFDPFHNAKPGESHQLAHDSFYGSWEGLPTSVVILNWHNNKPDTLKWFSDRGHQQVLAGYYDHDPSRIKEWLAQGAQVKGVCGVMYTSWVYDYSKLDEWMRYVKEFEAGK